MDSLKEFRNIFLERYLEKNKIGRKSISRSISKQKQPKPASFMKLSKSFDVKMLAKSNEDEFDDYNICKYFDFNTNASSAGISGSTHHLLTPDEDKSSDASKHLSLSFNLYNSSYTDSFMNTLKLNTNSSETLDSDLAFSFMSAQSSATNNEEDLFFKTDFSTKQEDHYFQGYFNLFKIFLSGLLFNFSLLLDTENKNETIFDLNFASNPIYISNYDDHMNNSMKIFDLDSEPNLF